MKKVFYLLVLLALAVSVSSCKKDIKTLGGTEWKVVKYDDFFNGSVMYSDECNGYVYPEYAKGELVLWINLWSDGKEVAHYPGDYEIVKYTDDELVIDYLYYEVDDISPADCVYEETFKGKKIYRYETSSYDYYFYLKPNGAAVDLGFEEFDDYFYYYDSCRIYCRRLK